MFSFSAAPTKKTTGGIASPYAVPSGVDTGVTKNPSYQWSPANADGTRSGPEEYTSNPAGSSPSLAALLSPAPTATSTRLPASMSSLAATSQPNEEYLHARSQNEARDARAQLDTRLQEAISQMQQQSRSLPQVSRVDGPSAEQEKASRDAAFARAKEKAGQNARASMAALGDYVDERGLMGSSVEASHAGAIVGGAGREVNDVIRDQAIEEANAATNRANLEFQGQVSQRGQDAGQQQQLQRAIQSLLLGGLY